MAQSLLAALHRLQAVEASSLTELESIILGHRTYVESLIANAQTLLPPVGRVVPAASFMESPLPQHKTKSARLLSPASTKQTNHRQPKATAAVALPSACAAYTKSQADDANAAVPHEQLQTDFIPVAVPAVPQAHEQSVATAAAPPAEANDLAVQGAEPADDAAAQAPVSKKRPARSKATATAAKRTKGAGGKGKAKPAQLEAEQGAEHSADCTQQAEMVVEEAFIPAITAGMAETSSTVQEHMNVPATAGLTEAQPSAATALAADDEAMLVAGVSVNVETEVPAAAPTEIPKPTGRITRSRVKKGGAADGPAVVVPELPPLMARATRGKRGQKAAQTAAPVEAVEAAAEPCAAAAPQHAAESAVVAAVEDAVCTIAPNVAVLSTAQPPLLTTACEPAEIEYVTAAEQAAPSPSAASAHAAADEASAAAPTSKPPTQPDSPAHELRSPIRRSSRLPHPAFLPLGTEGPSHHATPCLLPAAATAGRALRVIEPPASLNQTGFASASTAVSIAPTPQLFGCSSRSTGAPGNQPGQSQQPRSGSTAFQGFGLPGGRTSGAPDTPVVLTGPVPSPMTTTLLPMSSSAVAAAANIPDANIIPASAQSTPAAVMCKPQQANHPPANEGFGSPQEWQLVPSGAATAAAGPQQPPELSPPPTYADDLNPTVPGNALQPAGASQAMVTSGSEHSECQPGSAVTISLGTATATHDNVEHAESAASLAGTLHDDAAAVLPAVPTTIFSTSDWFKAGAGSAPVQVSIQALPADHLATAKDLSAAAAMVSEAGLDDPDSLHMPSQPAACGPAIAVNESAAADITDVSASAVVGSVPASVVSGSQSVATTAAAPKPRGGNVVTAVRSFLPSKKVMSPPPAAGKKGGKVKALEQAQAAKKAEEVRAAEKAKAKEESDLRRADFNSSKAAQNPTAMAAAAAASAAAAATAAALPVRKAGGGGVDRQHVDMEAGRSGAAGGASFATTEGTAQAGSVKARAAAIEEAARRAQEEKRKAAGREEHPTSSAQSGAAASGRAIHQPMQATTATATSAPTNAGPTTTISAGVAGVDGIKQRADINDKLKRAEVKRREEDERRKAEMEAKARAKDERGKKAAVAAQVQLPGHPVPAGGGGSRGMGMPVTVAAQLGGSSKVQEGARGKVLGAGKPDAASIAVKAELSEEKAVGPVGLIPLSAHLPSAHQHPATSTISQQLTTSSSQPQSQPSTQPTESQATTSAAWTGCMTPAATPIPRSKAPGLQPASSHHQNHHPHHHKPTGNAHGGGNASILAMQGAAPRTAGPTPGVAGVKRPAMTTAATAGGVKVKAEEAEVQEARNVQALVASPYVVQVKPRTPLGLQLPMKGPVLGHHMPAPSPVFNYNISPYRADSDSDDIDESDNRKPVPKWASSARILAAIQAQAKIDPDKLFQTSTMHTCHLEEVFAGMRPLAAPLHGNGKRRDWRRRGSSGDWSADSISLTEEFAYKRRMGFA